MGENSASLPVNTVFVVKPCDCQGDLSCTVDPLSLELHTETTERVIAYSAGDGDIGSRQMFRWMAQSTARFHNKWLFDLSENPPMSYSMTGERIPMSESQIEEWSR